MHGKTKNSIKLKVNVKSSVALPFKTLKMASKFEVFDPEGHDWTLYQERLESFFDTVKIVDDKLKVANLLSALNQAVYKLVRDACYPAAPKDKKYSELVNILKQHYSIKTNVWQIRKKFYDLKQGVETVVQWAAKVKNYACSCEFGDNLNNIILDKFITGGSSEAIFSRLAEEKSSLSLEKAIEIAQAKEVALTIRSSADILYVRNREAWHQSGGRNTSHKFKSSRDNHRQSGDNLKTVTNINN